MEKGKDREGLLGQYVLQLEQLEKQARAAIAAGQGAAGQSFFIKIEDIYAEACKDGFSKYALREVIALRKNLSNLYGHMLSPQNSKASRRGK